MFDSTKHFSKVQLNLLLRFASEDNDFMLTCMTWHNMLVFVRITVWLMILLKNMNSDSISVQKFPRLWLEDIL